MGNLPSLERVDVDLMHAIFSCKVVQEVKAAPRLAVTLIQTALDFAFA
jgi:hypothetical protein